MTRLAPGLLLAATVALASIGVAAVETRVIGHPVIEALVVAIVLGMAVRTTWSLSPSFEPGVRAAAKEVLEVAVVLLGLSVELPLLLRAGPALAIGIVLLVVLGMAASYALGRTLGLSRTLALLVAAGNAICGNSAIVALAPVIDAKREEVAQSIAFTALIGVLMVLGLPLLLVPLGLSHYQFGVLAGLTVYAVPQVLAATFPVSALAGQVGTLVKLVRVLMLGPVVIVFSVSQRARRGGTAAGVSAPSNRRFTITEFVPWFIVGFLLLAALRAAGLVPEPLIGPARLLTSALTVLAMAALGLGCDLRILAQAGRAVVLTVIGSLAVLLALSLSLIHGLGIR